MLLLLLVSGGASSPDVLSHLILRPVAVLCIGAMLWSGAWGPVHRQFPLIVLAAFGAILLLQLVPLPPAIWTALPGHGVYVRTANILGTAQPWHPISIAPDQTINSLLAFLPPLAVTIAAGSIRADQGRALVAPIVFAALASAALGIVQVTQDTGYMFTGHSLDVADGVFANRNHQAAFLSCAIALLGIWPELTARHAREITIRGIAAAMAAILLLMMILATGSRTGLLLGMIALAFALVFHLGGRPAGRSRRFAIAVALAGVGGLVVAMVVAGRTVSFDRLAGLGHQDEERVAAFPTLLRMIGEYLPFGSGYGTFDPAFRIVEPDRFLHYTFFNHAHDDAIELLITGGVPAVLVTLAVVGWWGWASLRVWRAPRTPQALVGRGASAVIALLGIASLSDYPLRTPLLASMFMLALQWLWFATRGPRCQSGVDG